MYVIYPHKSNREVGEHIRAQIEPLLLRHKVDLTISGHVHSYYRTCAVRHAQCMDDFGDLHIIPTNNSTSRANVAADAAQAAGGNSASSARRPGGGRMAQDGSLLRERHGIVHLVIGSAGRKLSDVERDQSDWCAETIKRWGYGRFIVKGSRSLLVEYVSSETGEVLDSVELRPEDAARGAFCSSARLDTS
jgi:hypothetical protein